MVKCGQPKISSLVAACCVVVASTSLIFWIRDGVHLEKMLLPFASRPSLRGDRVKSFWGTNHSRLKRSNEEDNGISSTAQAHLNVSGTLGIIHIPLGNVTVPSLEHDNTPNAAGHLNTTDGPVGNSIQIASQPMGRRGRRGRGESEGSRSHNHQPKPNSTNDANVWLRSAVRDSCREAVESVERVLFTTLDWEVARKAAVRASASCSGLEWIAECGGPDSLDIKQGHPSKGVVRIYTNNDTAPKMDRTVNHTTITWLTRLSQHKKKSVWQVALMGDSTVRGFIKAFAEHFIGSEASLLGGLARLFQTIIVTVEGEGFILKVAFEKNWSVAFADEAAKMLRLLLPKMDVFAWNVGQHALWAPYKKAMAFRRPSGMMQQGFFAKECRRLDDVLPRTTHAVYVYTNYLCPNDCTISTIGVNSTFGFLFNPEGADALNKRQTLELEEMTQRAHKRVMDSFELTRLRCNHTHDGNHFLPLDKHRVISLLMQLTILPPEIGRNDATAHVVNGTRAVHHR